MAKPLKVLTPNAQQIGAFIKKARKEKGLSQVDLAHKIGVTGASCSRLESGNSICLERLVKVADVLNVTLFEIISAGAYKGSKKAALDTLTEIALTSSISTNEINALIQLLKARETHA